MFAVLFYMKYLVAGWVAVTGHKGKGERFCGVLRHLLSMALASCSQVLLHQPDRHGEASAGTIQG